MHSIDSDNQNDNAMSPSENRPREEFHAINNNNDSKYLHKKFKKMASTAQPTISQGDHNLKHTVTSLTNNQSCSNLSLSQEPLSVKRFNSSSEVINNNAHHKYIINNSESESENNVQINHKDYLSDSVASATKDNVKISLNSDYVTNHDNKANEYREVCETNSKESANAPGNGRHVCPYCKLSCAKPSVLQKHIRAHTNERPYPCVPCGFAFKTKSNLYKHCRSRSHALRLHGSEEPSNFEDDWSLGSETDVINVSRSDSNLSSDKASVHGDPLAINENSTSDLVLDISSSNMTNSIVDSKPKTIYKPKFHSKASFYHDDDESTHKSVLSPNPEFLNRHISKIISDNKVIVGTIDTPLHKKYAKDNNSQKHLLNDNNLSPPCQDVLRNDNQPLNLTKNSEIPETNHRKRCYSESFALPESSKVPQHPLNPERSIIKDLLLKARAQATGLLPVTNETYDASDTLYVCSQCQISFKSTDNLEIHKNYYCKKISTTNANLLLNGIMSFANASKPEPIFTRSNSVHVTLPETYNPNTLAKLASSRLKSPLKRMNKPENLIILKNESLEVAAPLPSPGPLLGNTRLVDTQSVSEGLRQSVTYLTEERSRRSSPSTKRRSDSQSNDSISSTKIGDDNYQRSEIYSPPNKIRCTETPATLRSLEELSLSPMRQNTTSLQMFGGEVKILDNAGGSTTMRIEPTSQQSPTLISQTRVSPLAQGPETSSILVRSGLHSGATIVHNPPTPKEPLPSPHPQTPRLLVSIAQNITTPTLSVPTMQTPNITKFQFPIGPITAFNPLTLPLSPAASPGTIMHCGKLIPYVPGMPGPNTINSYSSAAHNLIKKVHNSAENLEYTGHDHILIEKYRMCNGLENDHKLQYSIAKTYTSTINSTEGKEDNSMLIIQSMPLDTTNAALKSPIPTIKINFEDSSPKQNSHPSAMNKRMAQKKIDEILRRNTEILQRTSTGNGESRSSKIDPKIFSPIKNLEKTYENPMVNTRTIEKEKRLSTPVELKQFNFENLISKSEIPNKQIESSSESRSNQTKTVTEESFIKISERSETSYFKKTVCSSGINNVTKSDSQKFLRPTSLPLKPGTFTPKRHHGITPNANTLPLISPETPRPAKAYGQLYLNGHAYTYLGLKCSTKVYYCTLNRPQPTYVPNQHALSMYSNWQVCSESTPHPLGLTPGKAISHYDSRHRPQNFTVASMKQDHLMTHSSRWSVTATKQTSPQSESDNGDDSKTTNNELPSVYKNNKSLAGGFESNEEYTYVRGRGRGRYVCSECGIRCKKPSMLKKHIRTHTDVRPFTCKHCAFSFKTKGNLTKHMKSKAHSRKCCELGISILDGIDSSDMSTGLGESDEDSETDDDGNEGETESSDTDSCKSRLEHEAAHCLLSLSGVRPAPGLLSTARPTTYPYTPCSNDSLTMSDDSKYTEVSSSHKDNVSSIIRKQHNIQSSVRNEKLLNQQNNQATSPIDLSKPMDLSKSDSRDSNRKTDRTLVLYPAEDILTPIGEPDLLASLALTTSKLPHRPNNWSNDEPMLQAYLTEKALQDSRIKQCQYSIGHLRQHDIDMKSAYSDCIKTKSSDNSQIYVQSSMKEIPVLIHSSTSIESIHSNDNSGIQTLAEIAANSVRLKTPPTSTTVSSINTAIVEKKSVDKSSNENAKFVASEYLKVVCGKSGNENVEPHVNNNREKLNNNVNPITGNSDEMVLNEKQNDIQKLAPEHIGVARKVVVGAGGVVPGGNGGFQMSSSKEFASFSKGLLTEDGRSVCVVCNKTFSKPSQLLLHINIHYIERPFRCSACAVSFRTRGHLQKHERSGSHHNKVSMTSTFGAATTTNPRPFKCSDCKIAFRIHGHLAKHLRSKMHVMRLECLGKLPFGTFAEIERAGVSLTDIDTTDCDNSLASLQFLAQKLHEKDPTKLDKWDPITMTPKLLPPGPESSDEEEPASPQAQTQIFVDNELKTVNDSDSPDETCKI